MESVSVVISRCYLSSNVAPPRAPSRSDPPVAPNRVVVIAVAHHVSQIDMFRALKQAQRDLPKAPEKAVLVLDCLQMREYERGARDAFVAWNVANRGRLRGVAVVSSRPFWQMVVSAMAVASGQEMKVFATMEPALAWARAR